MMSGEFIFFMEDLDLVICICFLEIKIVYRDDEWGVYLFLFLFFFYYLVFFMYSFFLYLYLFG